MNHRSVILLLCLLTACSEKPDNLQQLSTLTGIRFPLDTHIESTEKSTHNEIPAFNRRILFSPNIIPYATGEQYRLPSAPTIQSFKKRIPGILISKPDINVIAIEWNNKHGKWRGFWLNTDNGYFLDLEHISKSQ